MIQILWANIIADVPPAMSLGAEGFEVNIMSRPPRPKAEHVLTRLTSFIIVGQGMVLALITLAVYILAGATSGSANIVFDKDVQFLSSEHPELINQQTIAFVVLTMMQLVHSFMSRSVSESVFVTGVTGNRWMVGAFFLSTGLLVMSIYIPGFNTFLGMEPIGGISWAVVVVCLVFQVVVVEVGKIGVRAWMRKGEMALKTVDSEGGRA